jgi:hypothetical protein
MGQLGPARHRAMEEGDGVHPVCARGSRGTFLLQTAEGPGVRSAERRQRLTHGRSRGAGRGRRRPRGPQWVVVGWPRKEKRKWPDPRKE